ncbi:hypothetical protein ADU59_28210 [Pararhizobium polonicum]|uniref:Uncharacterized protein n=1 Tax=Pararhizobium polonicum TaxID=1612624 RepID=A0A1C7NTB1_9HYPH|nr:hypothetical protein [Pararhizobium polonicum]OBZ92219.1 hypothetical protein ADU59_28210 [Pararhizobium polonicum]
MASPWQFLARLVSPRHLEKQDGSAIKDVKPDVAVMAGPTETPVKENVKLAEKPTREEAQPFVQYQPVASRPEPSAGIGGELQDMRESRSDERAETSDPTLPDNGAPHTHPAPQVDETVKPLPAKRRGRAKTVEAVAVVSQTSPVVSNVSDQMSLDQEIGVLRDQLASKLRRQNAQLKQMLERFDR